MRPDVSHASCHFQLESLQGPRIRCSAGYASGAIKAPGSSAPNRTWCEGSGTVSTNVSMSIGISVMLGVIAWLVISGVLVAMTYTVRKLRRRLADKVAHSSAMSQSLHFTSTSLAPP